MDTVSRIEQAGFTLVELLVVIGIIAILMAILLPALSRARAAANRVVCMSNIRQLGHGILQYCQDNHGWFPTCAWADDSVSRTWFPNDWIFWENGRNLLDSAIAKYVAGGKDAERFKNLLRCPADTFEGRLPRPSWVKGQGPYMYSYSMNDGLASNETGFVWTSTKITLWRSPARRLVLTECMDQSSLFVPYAGGYTIYTYPEPEWGPASPRSRRHGTTVFKGNIPGNPWLAPGSKVGSWTSTFFLDGHVDGTDQDFQNNTDQTQPLVEIK